MSSKDIPAICQRIRDLMWEQHRNGVELASKAGISVRHLRRIRAGLRPGWKAGKKLADALGVEVSYLVYGE